MICATCVMHDILVIWDDKGAMWYTHVKCDDRREWFDLFFVVMQIGSVMGMCHVVPWKCSLCLYWCYLLEFGRHRKFTIFLSLFWILLYWFHSPWKGYLHNSPVKFKIMFNIGLNIILNLLVQSIMASLRKTWNRFWTLFYVKRFDVKLIQIVASFPSKILFGWDVYDVHLTDRYTPNILLELCVRYLSVIHLIPKYNVIISFSAYR